MDSELADGVRVSAGFATANETFAVSITAPLVPVIVMLLTPMVDVPAAITVAVAVAPDLMLDGLKVTVTPVGTLAFNVIGCV